ncbi:hypothetical protein VNO77_42478 [Canavalia gladiata]|uniref:WRKY domain-containing protein n=1 Tax=Canavalia gladiata TaxID=3824 RepID=A0AAN9PM17_CANGL
MKGVVMGGGKKLTMKTHLAPPCDFCNVRNFNDGTLKKERKKTIFLNMEFGSERSDLEGEGVKNEKRRESSVGDEKVRREQEIIVAPQEPSMSTMKKYTIPNASPTKKQEDDELENAKTEMGEVMEENERLKKSLNRILNDYRTLQVQFHNIVEQETKDSSDHKMNSNHQKIIEESELVSLSLGRVPRNNEKGKVSKALKEELEDKEGLTLGLEYKIETSKSGSTTEHLPNPSPTNSVEVPKEEVAKESWTPSKGHKTNIIDNGENEVSLQNATKKARVCVRARCDTPTLNDGCQWRKYGQKISKGNPCPRAYYRCTVSQSCPVRKQVQRCVQDMSILITTYEGIHNHPLPLSATAMASTTSAAASMLLSGSSTSHSGSTTMTTTTADLHGMNFYLSDGSKSKQFYLSHPSLSSSPSHPTITLDLTSNPPSSSSATFGRSFTSNYNSQKYPSSSLNFSSLESSNSTSWNNGFLSYNNQPYNNRNVNLGRQSVENIYNSYVQRNNIPVPSQNPMPLPDTIAAATKVITADPTFQSALAAALTSIIGSGSTQENQGVGENLNQKRKWGELFPSSTLPSSSKVNGCASSFLNKVPANTQTGSLMFLQPLSSPKSASGSPGDNRDGNN